MILKGNQRGGAYDLARHLMKDENERVEIHAVRGFVSQSLNGAFQESYAISRATKCKQHLYSLSLNPPKEAEASNTDFEKAIEAVEQRLSLQQQPRIIVLHEKYGEDGKLRRHAHAVWCRIDRQAIKAVEMSFDKDKLRSVARGLFIEHGWKMPLGFVKTQWRNPTNFTLAEWQQAKRAGKNAKQLKAMLQERWAISDSKSSFAHALKEQGFILAKGDRRGFVAVDHDGEAYPISRWVGVRAKQIRARLGEPDTLPTVAAAHKTAARLVSERLEQLEHKQRISFDQTRTDVLQKLKAVKSEQQRALLCLQEEQDQRERLEEEERQARLRKGLMGFIDRFTGRRKKTLEQNKHEVEQAKKQAEREKQTLLYSQNQSIHTLRQQAAKQRKEHRAVCSELRNDIRSLEEQYKEAMSRTPKVKRSNQQNREHLCYLNHEPEP
ncbi:relaxase [uncultured Roseibium sp.]|uniref:relaxase/mobilization nuclease domain-containing protein n=1 Tax=uncultured Roseibium sp. TaxID=1936171 RepID=UPI0026126F98|nr:relaxase [uncultured Roseibium sp.]